MSKPDRAGLVLVWRERARVKLGYFADELSALQLRFKVKLSVVFRLVMVNYCG